MFLRYRQQYPRAVVAIPIAFLLLALTLPRVFHPVTVAHQSLLDELTGFLTGLAIALMLVHLYLCGVERRRS